MKRTAAVMAGVLLILGLAACQVRLDDQPGIIGDGVTDDQVALQAAIDALNPGDTLVLSAGKTYAHSSVLRITTPDVTIKGEGTADQRPRLLSTARVPAGSPDPDPWTAVEVRADGVTVENLRIENAQAPDRPVISNRGSRPRNTGLLLGCPNKPADGEPCAGSSGITVKGVTITNSNTSGLMVAGAVGFLIDDVELVGTGAASLIINHGYDENGILRAAGPGTINNPKVLYPGDDGICVCSYLNAGEAGVGHDITINHPRYLNVAGATPLGRAFVVVGGRAITFNDVGAVGAPGPALMVSSDDDPKWRSPGAQTIRFNGGTITGSNSQQLTGGRSDGAIRIVNNVHGQTIDDVEVRDLTVRDTASWAYREIQVGGRDDNPKTSIDESAPGPTNVRLVNIAFPTSGPSYLLTLDPAQPSANVTTTGWTYANAAGTTVGIADSPPPPTGAFSRPAQ
jgi:hypothetical protein